jgi:hypothetical protein
MKSPRPAENVVFIQILLYSKALDVIDAGKYGVARMGE